MATKKTDPKKVERVAARIVELMAYKRRDFVNKVQEYVGRAYIEFYTQRLATKNGQTEWVQHWQTEVRNLLERNLVAALIHPIRGFTDRRKAFDAAMAELRARDASYRVVATNTIKRDYGLGNLKVHLDDQDEADFWANVAHAVEPALNVERLS
jgi:hypothetical protein